MEPGFIGLTPIDEVQLLRDGTTLFFVSDAISLVSECGFAYNPLRTPDVNEIPNDGEPNSYLSDSPFASGWWLFCENN
jgi:hypothetical protein